MAPALALRLMCVQLSIGNYRSSDKSQTVAARFEQWTDFLFRVARAYACGDVDLRRQTMVRAARSGLTMEIDAMSNKKRDPATDADASLREFVMRLRHMGYPGNVRLECPIFTPSDVRWCATLFDNAARELVDLVRALGPIGKRPKMPLEPVLRARAILQRLDSELKQCTTHNEVKQLRTA